MPDKKDSLDQLLASAMLKVCFQVKPSMQVARIREDLRIHREHNPDKMLLYLYVTDEDEKLIGIVSFMAVMFERNREREISTLLSEDKNIVKVVCDPKTTTVGDACEVFAIAQAMNRSFLALPVVDSTGKLIGIFDRRMYDEEIWKIAERKKAEDEYQLAGINTEKDQAVTTSGISVFWDRFKWLICTIVGGIFLAVVAGQYESVIQKVVVIAAFIPVALALAEGVAIQSVMLATHGDSQVGSIRRILVRTRREMFIGAALGLASSAILAIVVYAWKGTPLVALIVFLAIILSMALSTAIGSLVPLLVRKFSKNPGVASGPVSMVLADIVTLIIYLQTARFVVGG
jgi:magnesium transporter